MPRLPKKIIHVNQHNIRFNTKEADTSRHKPVLTVKTYKANHQVDEVVVSGPSRIVYRPHSPLACGARCWIETNSPVELVGTRGNVVV